MPLPVDQLKAHPRGQVSFNGSRMKQATMGRFNIKTGAKIKHTLAVQANGYVIGNIECSGTIELDISEMGPEFQYIQLAKVGKVCSFIFEIPTLQIEFAGVIEGIDGDLGIDDAVKISLAWVGRVQDPVI